MKQGSPEQGDLTLEQAVSLVGEMRSHLGDAQMTAEGRRYFNDLRTQVRSLRVEHERRADPDPRVKLLKFLERELIALLEHTRGRLN
jgi:hypothetical protein